MTFQVLLVTQTSIPTPPFSIKSLPNANRIDIVIRGILASYEGMLPTPEQVIVFFSNDHTSIIFPKNVISPMINDLTELSLGRDLLALFQDQNGQKDTRKEIFSEGVKIRTGITFQELVMQKIKQGLTPVLLDPQGVDIQEYFNTAKRTPEVFIIGARDDLNQEQTRYLNQVHAQTISLGKKQYLASQVITFLRYFHELMNHQLE